jgi:hypothetical protein
MSDATGADILDRIQTLCGDYRRQLKQGHRPKLQEYLIRFESASRDILFQNLLHIDMEYQRQSGGQPSSEEYLKSFPQFATLIRQAFFESTMLSGDMVEDTPDGRPDVMYGIPAARRLGEYELLRELGRGGFGVVYEASHVNRNDRVALKTVPSGFDGQSHPSGDAERLHRGNQRGQRRS